MASFNSIPSLTPKFAAMRSSRLPAYPMTPKRPVTTVPSSEFDAYRNLPATPRTPHPEATINQHPRDLAMGTPPPMETSPTQDRGRKARASSFYARNVPLTPNEPHPEAVSEGQVAGDPSRLLPMNPAANVRTSQGLAISDNTAKLRAQAAHLRRMPFVNRASAPGTITYGGNAPLREGDIEVSPGMFQRTTAAHPETDMSETALADRFDAIEAKEKQAGKLDDSVYGENYTVNRLASEEAGRQQRELHDVNVAQGKANVDATAASTGMTNAQTGLIGANADLIRQTIPESKAYLLAQIEAFKNTRGAERVEAYKAINAHLVQMLKLQGKDGQKAANPIKSPKDLEVLSTLLRDQGDDAEADRIIKDFAAGVGNPQPGQQQGQQPPQQQSNGGAVSGQGGARDEMQGPPHWTTPEVLPDKQGMDESGDVGPVVAGRNGKAYPQSWTDKKTGQRMVAGGFLPDGSVAYKPEQSAQNGAPNGGGQPVSQGRPLDPATARMILAAAGGDKAKAEQIARAEGFDPFAR